MPKRPQNLYVTLMKHVVNTRTIKETQSTFAALIEMGYAVLVALHAVQKVTL